MADGSLFDSEDDWLMLAPDDVVIVRTLAGDLIGYGIARSLVRKIKEMADE